MLFFFSVHCVQDGSAASPDPRGPSPVVRATPGHDQREPRRDHRPHQGTLSHQPDQGKLP